jgi:phosphoglycerate dehydrogenase-like enzyme
MSFVVEDESPSKASQQKHPRRDSQTEAPMKIAFLHKENDFTRQLLSDIKKKLPGHELLSWTSGEHPPASDLETLIAIGKVGPEQLDGQPNLAFVQTASTGYESVDIDAATERGIWVSYAPSEITGNAVSVAEFAVLLMLGAARRLAEELRAQAKGEVAPPRINPALQGKTACIVGLGAIGKLVIDRLKPFEMKIVATDEHPDHAPDGVTAYPADQLKKAVAEADFVVICVRASEENKNLIDASVMAAMKRGAILVNIARGSLVDEKALLEAVQNGQLGGAGLDVLATEPPDPKDPLLALPTVLVTPHIAGFTDIMLDGTVDYVAKVIHEVTAGRKPDSVLNNPQNPRMELK